MRTIVLGRAADDDLASIAAWTAAQFGARQAEAYIEALLDVFEELTEGEPLRSRGRDDIGPGLRTLHMTRPGRRGRHFILYRTDEHVVAILRILHDSMEVERHLPPSQD